MVPCGTLSPGPSTEEAHGVHWLAVRILAPGLLGDLLSNPHLFFCLAGFQFLFWVGVRGAVWDL